MKINVNKVSIPILIITTLISLIYIFSRDIIVQNTLYHHFIDTRSWFGIPNFFDVLSNIFFLVFGSMGLSLVLKDKTQFARKSWIIFFIGIILVAPGSAYYHWSPDNKTLVWDRLPMTIGFMALYVALLTEHINLKLEKLLIPFCLLGLASVVWWVYSTDLRFYYWIQLAPIITIPIILIFFPSRYTGKMWFLLVLVAYLLAKVAELFDAEVYSITQNQISGHTLKHILAALAILVVWHMLKTRTQIKEK